MTEIGWHPHYDVWLLVAFLAGAYEWAARTVGPRMVHPIERPVTRSQRTFFYLGLASLWLATDWPIHDIGEQALFSAHMIEHMLIAFVAPPLLLLGTPDWMLRRLLGPLVGVARFVTRPLIALVLFNAVIALIHVPFVVDAMLSSAAFHFGAHALVLGAALCMWSPVVNPMIELPKLSYPQRMLYLFLQSLVPTVPASYLTFGETVLYRFYEGVPRLWGISAIADQQIAGLIMKLGGGLLLWSVIAYYFFRWSSLEEREGVDVTEWNKLEPSKVDVR